MRKTFALLLCCFGLLFSPLALAEVPESTWESMVGHSVLLTNPQGKEIRGTLLDAEGDTIRIERADGSVVTVGKAEVATATDLSAPKAAPEPEIKEPEPVAPIAPEPITPEPAPQAEPDPAPQDPAPQTTPNPAPEVDPNPPAAPSDPVPLAPQGSEDQLMQDRVAGEVDGRAAAQMESLRGPAVLSAGVGLAGGSCFCCAGATCAAVPVLIYGLKKVPEVEAGGSEAYNAAYNAAYASELKKRRWIWTGVGAGAGLAVGMGVWATLNATGGVTLDPNIVQ